MNWKRKKKFLVHHWQMSVSFKVKDEIQFPPFYGQYFMYYFQLCLKGGPAGEGLGHDNEVIMFEAIFAPHFDTSTEKMFSA